MKRDSHYWGKRGKHNHLNLGDVYSDRKNAHKKNVQCNELKTHSPSSPPTTRVFKRRVHMRHGRTIMNNRTIETTRRLAMIRKSCDAVIHKLEGIARHADLVSRWAVIFNELEIMYLLSPEPVVLDDGTSYSFDFYLPEQDGYFECYGSNASPGAILKIIDSGKKVFIGYVDFSFCACDDWRYMENGHPSYTLADPDMSELVRCTECGSVFFMGLGGSYRCQCCGAYDGDHYITNVEEEFASAVRKARARS